MSEQAEATSTEEKVATPEAAVETAAVEAPYYAKYGEYESPEAFDAKIEAWKSLEQREQTIAQTEADYQEKLSIFGSVEDEPDPDVVMLTSLKKKGIDRAVANDLMNHTPEQLEANPMKALLLAEAISDPAGFAKHRDKIEKAIRETYNLPEEGEYTPTARMEVDSLKAIEKINKLKADVGEYKDPIIFARSKRNEEREAFANSQKVALTELESIVGGLTEVVDKQGDKTFNLKVTKEDVALILGEKEQVASFFHNANTPEGKAALDTYIKERILIHKYKSGEVFKEWEANYAADVKQQTVKEVLEGDARTIDRSGQSNETGAVSPLLKYAPAQRK